MPIFFKRKLPRIPSQQPLLLAGKNKPLCFGYRLFAHLKPQKFNLLSLQKRFELKPGTKKDIFDMLLDRGNNL